MSVKLTMVGTIKIEGAFNIRGNISDERVGCFKDIDDCSSFPLFRTGTHHVAMLHNTSGECVGFGVYGSMDLPTDRERMQAAVASKSTKMLTVVNNAIGYPGQSCPRHIGRMEWTQSHVITKGTNPYAFVAVIPPGNYRIVRYHDYIGFGGLKTKGKYGRDDNYFAVEYIREDGFEESVSMPMHRVLLRKTPGYWQLPLNVMVEVAKRKNINLTYAEFYGGEYEYVAKPMPTAEPFVAYVLRDANGDEFFLDESSRTDSTLIEVMQNLGKLEGGEWKVAEIPADYHYRIVDGNEGEILVYSATPIEAL